MWENLRGTAALAIFGLVAACGSDDAEPTATAPDREAASTCSRPTGSPDGPSASVVTLQDAGDDRPRVEAVVYPRPDYEGNPWTQWGQGLVLADGRFLSAIGDHHGADGNSFLFVFDPNSGEITRFADVLSAVQHRRGDWGYGKVHAPMVEIACDQVVFATYWGTRRGLAYRGSYRGDLLFSIDTAAMEIEPLGVPIAEHGIPSLATHDGLVYGEAVDPEGQGDDGDSGAFFVYDPESREVLYRSDDERHTGFRSILVDVDGRAFLAMADGGLLVYEPGTDGLTEHHDQLPSGWLRAGTVPDSNGVVYGVTTDPPRLFALGAGGDIEDLGAAVGYTTALALDPTGERVVYVPGAHGNSWERGAPLMELDPETGEQQVLAELNRLAEKQLGLTLGGSYDLVVDAARSVAYIGLNAGTSRDEPWGEVVLFVVHL